ncbi:hypothetical protein [Pseudonocardia alaniniphila]|uniref:Uncharacterized protein n=1 Tax=Pseudonocardia alaniniphila TaxID=75291 RepID=A0ABS9TS54_9PSEU|nr:hypothetical protein [Pseudonocardia alaniniphila]MCH6171392.1 hypothetical protein [Pseudonocardia alaniniphila]
MASGSHGERPVGWFLARAFGARELAIALATLLGPTYRPRAGLRLGMIADTADVASILARTTAARHRGRGRARDRWRRRTLRHSRRRRPRRR